MSFTPAQSLSSLGVKAKLFDHSSPAAVNYNDKLYLFYTNSNQAHIHYTTCGPNGSWTAPVDIHDSVPNLGIAKNTSPSAVVFKNSIYLFYNGVGNDGTWCTVYNGSKWDIAFSVSRQMDGQSFPKETSPCAVVYSSQIWLFWNPSSNVGLLSSTSANGNDWSSQQRVRDFGIADNTSPCAIPFNGQLYLFWTGGGNDGMWYSTTSGGKWEGQKTLGISMAILKGTSPTALVLADEWRLRVMWAGAGGSVQGAWYSDFNKVAWSKQKNMGPEISGQSFLDLTMPCAVTRFSIPYVFWVMPQQELAFSQGLNYDLGAADFSGPPGSIAQGKTFTVLSSDPDTVSYFQKKLGGNMDIDPQNASSVDLSTFIAKLTGGWDIQGFVRIADKVARAFGLCAVRKSVQSLIRIRFNPNAANPLMTIAVCCQA